MSTILYYHPTYILTIVPAYLAKYFKTDIKCTNIESDKENFIKDFPMHKCPAIINRETGLNLSQAISVNNYIIKTFCKDPEEVKKLLGSTVLEEAEILKWQSFSSSDFLTREAYYVKPLIGMMPYDADAYVETKKQFEAVVNIFEDHLKNRQFLVSDHITLADLAGATSFFFGFNFALDEEWSQKYPNITRWYKEVIKSPYISSFFEDKQQVKIAPQPPK